MFLKLRLNHKWNISFLDLPNRLILRFLHFSFSKAVLSLSSQWQPDLLTNRCLSRELSVNLFGTSLTLLFSPKNDDTSDTFL